MTSDEEWVYGLLGWKWYAYQGVPVRSAPDYPKEQSVRVFVSPEYATSWRDFIEQKCTVATGNEPLAYMYCSSSGAPDPPELNEKKCVSLFRKLTKKRGRIDLSCVSGGWVASSSGFSGTGKTATKALLNLLVDATKPR